MSTDETQSPQEDPSLKIPKQMKSVVFPVTPLTSPKKRFYKKWWFWCGILILPVLISFTAKAVSEKVLIGEWRGTDKDGNEVRLVIRSGGKWSARIEDKSDCCDGGGTWTSSGDDSAKLVIDKDGASWWTRDKRYPQGTEGTCTFIPGGNIIKINCADFVSDNMVRCITAEVATSSARDPSPVGVFKGNAPMGPSTYVLKSDGTYSFIGTGEVDRGTWSQSGTVITFNNQGVRYSMDLSSDGRCLGPSWERQ
jgi:hypothetical protein